MYKIYFKQAIQMLNQNRFISIVTIIGTALAITMIMVIIVTQSIRNISIAPEINRDRTLYLKFESKENKEAKYPSNNCLGYNSYKQYLSNLETPELTSLMKIPYWDESQKCLVTTDSGTDRTGMKVHAVDAVFWKLMSFRFMEGKPFTQEEFESGIKKVILTESASEKLFGKQSPMGKTIYIDFETYTVCGIVKDVSPTFIYAHAELYIPYTSVYNYEEMMYVALFLAKSKNDFDAVKEEVRNNQLRYYAAAEPGYTIKPHGPYDHKVQLLDIWADQEPEEKKNARKTLFTLIILLLIPAVNLSGFSMSRIKKRTEEIGIRKAFGAKKHTILIQVLYENFITSLIGGMIGLLFSFGMVYWLKEWLLKIGSTDAISIQTLVSFPVFLSVFMACMLLNLISAGLPAYRASKMNIVNSINNNNL